MNVLILTAAINIENKNIPNTVLTDTQGRLQQYISSIEFAVDNYKTISTIIFCDNTNYNFDYTPIISYAKKKGKVLEVLLFEGNKNEIERKGKGYGEGEIINYILNNSLYIHNYTSFYKLTGRLFVKNFDEVERTSKKDICFITYHQELTRTKDLVSTVFYKVNIIFYKKYLLNSYQNVNDIEGKYLEMVFFENLKNQQEVEITSFKTMPIISGISGSTSLPYDLSKLNIIKEYIFNNLGIYDLRKSRLTKKFLKFITVFRP